MSIDEKKNSEKMKKMDPKKADQMLRLGMGMGSQRYSVLYFTPCLSSSLF